MTAEPPPSMAEEAWEAEIGSLLAELPTVDPPTGFIDAALDHRPLNGGRVLASLVGATMVLLAAAGATGLAGRRMVVPPVDELVAQHDLAARAGLVDPAGTEADGGPPSPVELPDGFRAETTDDIEGALRSIYARGDESLLVYVQDGEVDWAALPGAGLTEHEGRRAWVDGARSVVVLEADGAAVTVVGLDEDSVHEVIQAIESAPASWPGRAAELAEALVVPLGFTTTD